MSETPEEPVAPVDIPLVYTEDDLNDQVRIAMATKDRQIADLNQSLSEAQAHINDLTISNNRISVALKVASDEIQSTAADWAAFTSHFEAASSFAAPSIQKRPIPGGS